MPQCENKEKIVQSEMYGVIFGTMIVGFNVFRIVYTKSLRVYTGWEDPETPEFQVKQIENFLEKNKDAEVIKLNPNPENYF